MKRTKGENGITLIALVITIVVLLILAAVTITFVLSDGGIFKQAREARWEQEAAAIRDYTLSAQTAIGLEYLNPKYKENGAGSSAPSRTSINLFDMFRQSFPAEYEIRQWGTFEFSEAAYDNRIEKAKLSITTDRCPDILFWVEFKNGIAYVTWEDHINLRATPEE